MRFTRQQEDKQEDEGSLSTMNDCSLGCGNMQVLVCFRSWRVVEGLTFHIPTCCSSTAIMLTGPASLWPCEEPSQRGHLDVLAKPSGVVKLVCVLSDDCPS